MKTFRTLLAALAAVLLSAVGVANAGTLSISPSNTEVGIGDIFNLDIKGSDFLDTIVGGGFDIAFNGAALELVSVTIDPSWEFAPSGGVIDNAAGSLTDASFNSFTTPRSGDFNVATLSFRAVAAGLWEVALAPSAVFVFSDIAANEVTPLFGSAEVLVVVPEPGVVAMMLGGLALLGFALRGRKAT